MNDVTKCIDPKVVEDLKKIDDLKKYGESQKLTGAKNAPQKPLKPVTDLRQKGVEL
jgi:hypothetical protein